MADIPEVVRLLRRHHGNAREVLRDLAVVVALHPPGHAGTVEVILYGVAAGLGNHVDDRATNFRFAEPAGGGHHHFLGVLELTVPRNAATVDCRPSAEAIQLALSLVASPTAATEHDHSGGQLDVGIAATGLD